MEESLDLKGYWRILVKRWWIVALCVSVGVGSAGLLVFLEGRSRVPEYQATAKLLLQGGQIAVVGQREDSEASNQVAQYYDDLVKTRPFLERVSNELGLDQGLDALSDKIEVIRPSTLIQIRVRDRNPVSAAQIANSTARTLIVDLRDRQLGHIAQFQGALNQYGITQDPSIIAAQFAGLTSLSMSEEALPPTTPTNIGTRVELTFVLGAILGLLAAGLLIFVLEQLDDRIKSPVELKELTGLPTLATVVRVRKVDLPKMLNFSDQDQLRGLTESYKFLSTNLDFAANNARSLLVTSSKPGEGKTTTAINFAISMAKEGKSIILVDADLRKPNLHHLFDMESLNGLTNLLLGKASLEEVLQPTSIPGLSLICAGPLPPDPTALLRGSGTKKLIALLQERVDLVVFDSPPLLLVTDPMLMAGQVDAVLLVVDSHTTGRSVIIQSVETLKKAKPAFVGFVLNKINPKSREGYYYSYGYQYYSYGENGQKNSDSRRTRLVSRIFRRGV